MKRKKERKEASFGWQTGSDVCALLIIMQLSRRYLSMDVVRAKNLVLHVQLYAHHSLHAHMDKHLKGNTICHNAYLLHKMCMISSIWLFSL